MGALRSSSGNGLRAAAQRAIDRCTVIAGFTEVPQSIQRTFLSPPMRECHREIAKWMNSLYVDARIDAAGNLRAVYPGATNGVPRLLIGSHLDTVPNAGAYDGVLGVTLAVALIEQLQGEKLPFAIELIGFSDEEGIRFGIPFIGSRALVNTLDEKLLQQPDADGVTIRQAIERFGINPDDIAEARLAPDTLGYVEFHIEQGPVLAQVGLPLAAVDAIVGQSRFEIIFRGTANHAGTTPMNSRRDALTGAAEWIVEVERAARETSGLVATVGSIQAQPGAANVIAGEARLTLDVRHASDGIRLRAVDDLLRRAEEVAARRNLHVRCNERARQCAVAMDPFLVRQIETAIAQAGCETRRMSSGAGHDAMILAGRIPSAMIFLRSPGGISHNPAETVEIADVEKAIEAGSHLLHRLASSPEFLRRNARA